MPAYVRVPNGENQAYVVFELNARASGIEHSAKEIGTCMLRVRARARARSRYV